MTDGAAGLMSMDAASPTAADRRFLDSWQDMMFMDTLESLNGLPMLDSGGLRLETLLQQQMPHLPPDEVAAPDEGKLALMMGSIDLLADVWADGPGLREGASTDLGRPSQASDATRPSAPPCPPLSELFLDTSMGTSHPAPPTQPHDPAAPAPQQPTRPEAPAQSALLHASNAAGDVAGAEGRPHRVDNVGCAASAPVPELLPLPLPPQRTHHLPGLASLQRAPWSPGGRPAQAPPPGWVSGGLASPELQPHSVSHPLSYDHYQGLGGTVAASTAAPRPNSESVVQVRRITLLEPGRYEFCANARAAQVTAAAPPAATTAAPMQNAFRSTSAGGGGTVTALGGSGSRPVEYVTLLDVDTSPCDLWDELFGDGERGKPVGPMGRPLRGPPGGGTAPSRDPVWKSDSAPPELAWVPPQAQQPNQRSLLTPAEVVALAAARQSACADPSGWHWGPGPEAHCISAPAPSPPSSAGPIAPLTGGMAGPSSGAVGSAAAAPAVGFMHRASSTALSPGLVKQESGLPEAAAEGPGLKAFDSLGPFSPFSAAVSAVLDPAAHGTLAASKFGSLGGGAGARELVSRSERLEGGISRLKARSDGSNEAPGCLSPFLTSALDSVPEAPEGLGLPVRTNAPRAGAPVAVFNVATMQLRTQSFPATEPLPKLMMQSLDSGDCPVLRTTSEPHLVSCADQGRRGSGGGGLGLSRFRGTGGGGAAAGGAATVGYVMEVKTEPVLSVGAGEGDVRSPLQLLPLAHPPLRLERRSAGPDVPLLADLEAQRQLLVGVTDLRVGGGGDAGGVRSLQAAFPLGPAAVTQPQPARLSWGLAHPVTGDSKYDFSTGAWEAANDPDATAAGVAGHLGDVAAGPGPQDARDRRRAASGARAAVRAAAGCPVAEAEVELGAGGEADAAAGKDSDGGGGGRGGGGRGGGGRGGGGRGGGGRGGGRGRAPRGGRRAAPLLSRTVLKEYYHRPIKQIATELGYSLSCFKKECRRLGVPRWPARKLNCLTKMRDTLMRDGSMPAHAKEDLLRRMQYNVEAIMANPDAAMYDELERVRHDQYKARSSGRRAGGGGGGGRGGRRRAAPRGVGRQRGDSDGEDGDEDDATSDEGTDAE